MGKIFKSDGSIIENYDCSTYQSKRDAVNGYIEPIFLPSDVGIMLVNEEGKLRNLPFNLNASKICRQELVGDCLLMTYDEWNEQQ